MAIRSQPSDVIDAATALKREMGSMSEKRLQGTVIEYAKALGWAYYHPFDSRRSVKGWPDLILVRGTRIVAAELKRQGGRTTPEQVAWLDMLDATGKVETYVWRPSNINEIWEALQ